MSDAQFARRVLITLALAAAVALVWVLGGILLLLFGAIVIAVVIRAGGEALAQRSRTLSPRWASMLVVFAAALLFTGIAVIVGDNVGEQFAELRQRLPEAAEQAREWVRRNEFAGMLLPRIEEAAGGGFDIGEAMGAVSMTFTALAHAVLVVLLAVYLAFNPHLYVRGAVSLAPARLRPRVEEAFGVSGHALRRWLLGQFASMVAVGLLTGIGLWIAGVPLALVLGILAGLLEFVPVAGPIIAAIPGILLAFSVSPLTALYALLVYVIVQQLESGVIMPLAQRWSVHLPPALGLFAIVVAAMLFGVPGILFATPLTVVVMVLVKRYWVETH